MSEICDVCKREDKPIFTFFFGKYVCYDCWDIVRHDYLKGRLERRE